ncbi:unnamed protein product [Heligmosomoides polygyrus]|uniref:Uncharacterized protein n=1 Tax=Heligmosomoides polygyrus TaxID=6339 RepID=A0A183G992_HELPZ|nr:unnamed protein product [Heligmosomoides polygyrus]
MVGGRLQPPQPTKWRNFGVASRTAATYDTISGLSEFVQKRKERKCWDVAGRKRRHGPPRPLTGTDAAEERRTRDRSRTNAVRGPADR